MKKVRLYLKKYLTQLLIRVILGRVSEYRLEAIAENAHRCHDSAFGRRGCVYRSVKLFDTSLSKGEIEAATQLIIFLDETKKELEG